MLPAPNRAVCAMSLASTLLWGGCLHLWKDSFAISWTTIILLEALSAASVMDLMAFLFAAPVMPSGVKALQSDQPTKPLHPSSVGLQKAHQPWLQHSSTSSWYFPLRALVNLWSAYDYDQLFRIQLYTNNLKKFLVWEIPPQKYKVLSLTHSLLFTFCVCIYFQQTEQPWTVPSYFL